MELMSVWHGLIAACVMLIVITDSTQRWMMCLRDGTDP